ncbi:glycerophosphodiester phosphodiesterase family protein [Mucilaginibacter sabulilitoris]|uniref:Glycerophosphodiester phosphodiesterase family protein n=1 Tax=Mucilaginibacter sabulilitoris TaxID=1173583 RepID=A0ABZ0TJV8_9SPHI|nr:glycerophosphodiester phosphodiesterase family protein [Mucilaginibacter sabulilitoris]WPU92722.1 glycerophosphodiester phosphodiesterase family protein [Mucilaginibacter sabulilitoris]
MNRLSSTKVFLSCLLLVVTAKVSSAQTEINTLHFKSANEFQQYFKHTGKDMPVISGHRGGTTTGYPENCGATFENTLKHTPAFFEIDPRLTKDSVVVLMHDETLDRTTTGKGKVSDYTFAELQQFRLKDPQGNVTDYKIPTLKDVILWSKGKTVLNLDHKDVPLEMTAKILKECKNDEVMLTVHNAQQARFYYDNNPKNMMSAFVLTKEAFYTYEKAGVPWKNMIAYIGPTNKPENKELLDLLHAKGVMCMISAAPSYDKLKDSAERATHYRETFTMGADILESDLPIEVATAIKSIMPESGLQKKFWGKAKL